MPDFLLYFLREEDPSLTKTNLRMALKNTNSPLNQQFKHLVTSSNNLMSNKDFFVFLNNLGPAFWQKFESTQSNRNRKRSAQVLKTYFCDDLTPIEIVQDEKHTKNDLHASSPACQACHYKLDPMGGFFRSINNDGTKATEMSIAFANGNLTGNDSVKKYLANWEPPLGSIGYIRSSEDPKINTYKSKFEDLFAVLKTAPEVRSCIAKKTIEYFLSANQFYDGEWFENLAQEFSQSANDNSSQAFKTLVKKVVLSKAYKTSNRAENECYDFAQQPAENSPPCDVAYILKTNCVSCHNSTKARGGLNLAVWQQDTNKQFNFLFKDKDSEVSAAETMKRIANSLKSTDSQLRMPQSMNMLTRHRDTLYLWVNKKLQENSSKNEDEGAK